MVIGHTNYLDQYVGDGIIQSVNIKVPWGACTV